MHHKNQFVTSMAASVLLAANLLTLNPVSAATPAASDRSQIVTVLKANIHATKLVVGKVFQEETYAIARWTTGDGNSGGEALVKYDGTKWALVAQGGGSMKDAKYIESFGVPATAAKALVGDLNANGGY